jgi:hypothetical protein
LLESLKLGLEIERSRVLYRGEIYWHLICELSRGFFSCQTGSTEKDRQTEIVFVFGDLVRAVGSWVDFGVL